MIFEEGLIISKIPKVIHYCWFGKGKKPSMALKCIDSWKKYLPDYKIIEWNEENFDINTNLYTKQSYNAKKYAFVSDFVRLQVLYEQGGVYMDTDVEVLKNIDEFLEHSAFSGFESNEFIPTGIMGCIKGHSWVKSLLKYYINRPFINNDGTFDLTTNTKTITSITKKEYKLKSGNYKQVLNNEIVIYPSEYFCPKNWLTKELNLTRNTHTIHHFSGSWLPKNYKYKKFRLKIYSKIVNTLIICLGKKKYMKLRKVISRAM